VWDFCFKSLSQQVLPQFMYLVPYSHYQSLPLYPYIFRIRINLRLQFSLDCTVPYKYLSKVNVSDSDKINNKICSSCNFCCKINYSTSHGHEFNCRKITVTIFIMFYNNNKWIITSIYNPYDFTYNWSKSGSSNLKANR